MLQFTYNFVTNNQISIERMLFWLVGVSNILSLKWFYSSIWAWMIEISEVNDQGFKSHNIPTFSQRSKLMAVRNWYFWILSEFVINGIHI